MDLDAQELGYPSSLTIFQDLMESTYCCILSNIMIVRSGNGSKGEPADTRRGRGGFVSEGVAELRNRNTTPHCLGLKRAQYSLLWGKYDLIP